MAQIESEDRLWHCIHATIGTVGRDEPGLAFAVWQGDRAHYLCKGALRRNGPAITPDTIFDLASVSKMFTALATLLAADEFGFDTDTLLGDLLPAMRQAAPQVRIGHLLHHLSGLPDYMTLFEAEGIGPHQAIGQSETLALLARQPPGLPAGRELSYSNTGYVLLASLVERLSGERLADYMRMRVFEPLGMLRTTLVDRMPPRMADCAQSYASREGAEVNPLWEMVGDGQVHSCLGDLRLWQRELRQPRLFAPQIARMQQPGRRDDGQPLDYGYGIAHERLAGESAYGHDGGWAGFTSSLLVIPGRDLALAALANRSDIEAGELTRSCAAVWINTASSLPKA